jgi:hypothetical protein
MRWIALACTAENEILAWSNELSILESACDGEFRAICRIYGIDEQFALQFAQGNLNFRLKFDGPRNTTCEAFDRGPEINQLSGILQARVGLTAELYQRLAHGFKRFSPVVEWQEEAYQQKYAEALNHVLFKAENSQTGMIEDYAEEAGLDIDVAAGLIINKYQNRKFLIRKLERLRIRHQLAIRTASSKADFLDIKSKMEEDSFLSMMM